MSDPRLPEPTDRKAPRPEPIEGVVDKRPGRAEDPNLRALDSIAWLLDDIIRIPGLNVRLGLDVLIGLVPGIGDVAGTALGSAVLIGSVRYRVPMRVLLLMAWNLFVDQILGLLPFVGDAADAIHRANRKNFDLLQRTIARGETVDTDARGYALRAGALVTVLILALVAVTAVTLWLLWQVVSGVLGI